MPKMMRRKEIEFQVKRHEELAKEIADEEYSTLNHLNEYYQRGYVAALKDVLG